MGRRQGTAISNIEYRISYILFIMAMPEVGIGSSRERSIKATMLFPRGQRPLRNSANEKSAEDIM